MPPFICFSDPKTGSDAKRIRYLNLQYVVSACYDESSGKLTITTAVPRNIEDGGRPVLFTYELSGQEAADAMGKIRTVLG